MIRRAVIVMLLVLSCGGPVAAADTGGETDGLVAEIRIPAPRALVRGDVPVYGLAYGRDFSVYVLEYGRGADPDEWILINRSSDSQNTVSQLSTVNFNLVKTIAGNLGMWVTGLSEYPYADYPVDLPMGTYTLRLRVRDQNGREKTDRVRVQVGRVALNCCGGLIESPDGRARLLIREHSLYEPARVFSLLPLSGRPDLLPPRDEGRLISRLYRVQPSGAIFTEDAIFQLVIDQEELRDNEQVRLGIYDPLTEGWKLTSMRYQPQEGLYVAAIGRLPQKFCVVAAFASQTDRAVSADEPTVEPPPFNKHTLVYNTFDDGPDQWANKHRDKGAQLSVVEDGCRSGPCLQLRNVPGGGSFAARAYAWPFDARRYRILRFDYRIPPGVKTNLLVKTGGRWHDIEFTDDPKIYWDINMEKIGAFENVEQDDAWHEARIDLLAMLQSRTDNFQVDEVVFADWEATGFKKLEFGQTPPGAAFFIDNFRIGEE